MPKAVIHNFINRRILNGNYNELIDEQNANKKENDLVQDPNCLFCKIIKGEIPSEKVYEDEEILAFEDINPQAPIHILIIPKNHIPTMQDMTEANEPVLGKLLRIGSQLAKDKQLDKGYRLVINCLEDGGQEVFHIHVHLLGGRRLTWPPG